MMSDGMKKYQRYEIETQGMKQTQKVIKCVLRYEIGVFLKNSDFAYLYGSISYLFGYEKNRCFFLMEAQCCVSGSSTFPGAGGISC